MAERISFGFELKYEGDYEVINVYFEDNGTKIETEISIKSGSHKFYSQCLTVNDCQDLLIIEKEEISSIKKEEISPFKKEETSSFKKEEISPFKKKEIFSIKRKEIFSIKKEEISPFKKKEISLFKKKEIFSIKEEEISPFKKKEISSFKKEEISPFKKDEISSFNKEEISYLEEYDHSFVPDLDAFINTPRYKTSSRRHSLSVTKPSPAKKSMENSKVENKINFEEKESKKVMKIKKKPTPRKTRGNKIQNDITTNANEEEPIAKRTRQRTTNALVKNSENRLEGIKIKDKQTRVLSEVDVNAPKNDITIKNSNQQARKTLENCRRNTKNTKS